ncbi:endonuclease domain-containing 1 protein-like [Mercenaria mercenaria]|uniref:endonuclease domain-containing 1 protein-like n=1 Tax=Mercenaria mercenaria TaxID=6596 RepID=UPI00234F4BB3|nr:endonuclease domain-containing 1 protein-like [Mercenaria mercenaria]
MHVDILLALTLCVRIAEGEVVNSFNKCRSFFYKRSPPSGFEYDGLSEICQMYQIENRYHFATLYSSEDRVPIYSAYTLDTFYCPPNQPSRRSKWFIEPQLSGLIYSKHMTTEGNAADSYKIEQAINIDYPNTSYDRGHLNPNFYQGNEGRTATFTLTNAVPQDPCFNQQIWKDMEKRSKVIMETRCNFYGARRYFVTGAVPSKNKIPSVLHDNEGDQTREYNRVSVPSGMWTAACCDSSNAVYADDRDKGFSFGYYGDNVPDSYVFPYTIDLLEETLATKYMVNTFEIFADSCYSSSKTTEVVLSELSIPVERKIAETLANMGDSSESSLRPAKRTFIGYVNSNLHDNEAFAKNNWRLADVDFGLKEKRSDIQNTRDLLALFEMTTLLTCASNNNVGKREVYDLANEKGDDYVVVPTLESTLSATGSRCRQDHPCGYHKKSYQWCYIDWSSNWDYCCIDACGFEQSTSYAWCYTSYSKHWAYCSQRSSMISVSGKQCRADHECGLHGKWYHWCYTDTNNNWDYCCQPWHECDNHEKSYKWCYYSYMKESYWKYCYY